MLRSIHYNPNSCFIQGDIIYPPSEIQNQISIFQDELKRRNLPENSFIYLIAPNHVKTIFAYLSIISSGHSCVLINPCIKDLEIQELTKEIQPCLTINIDPHQHNLDIKKEFIDHPENDEISTHPEKLSYTVIFSAAEDGCYKAVLLTPENVYSVAKGLSEVNLADHKSTTCALIPFHHLYGLVTGVLSPILSGSSILIEEVSEMRGIKKIVNRIENYKVTHLYTVPIIYYIFTKINSIAEKFKAVQVASSGGYKLSPEIFTLFKERTGLEIREGYGLTEAAPICTWNVVNEPVKIDSVGKALNYCQIKILADDNKEMPMGQIGEVCVRGKNVMREYYNHKSVTTKTLQDGWLRTGDLGYLDKDGYLYLQGLKKSMFNPGGMNVYPLELKKLIKNNNNVDIVTIHAESNEYEGHILSAEIGLKSDSEMERKLFKEWCIKNISNFKLPRKYQFI